LVGLYLLSKSDSPPPLSAALPFEEFDVEGDGLGEGKGEGVGDGDGEVDSFPFSGNRRALDPVRLYSS